MKQKESELIRILLLMALILNTTNTYSSERRDSTRLKLSASASFSINSNGISSIPAFSLGKPAVVASLGLAKGRLSYDPTLAYGLDAKPWYIDSWIHYLIIDRTVFKLRTGVNFSMYFSHLNPPLEQTLQGQRYWAVELAGLFNFTPTSNLTLMYWSDNGQDHGTLQGHFLSISGEKSGIKLGKAFQMSAYFQIFYINYNGNNDGLFVTPKISFSVRNLPMSVFIQIIQPLETNISPAPGYQWNVGLVYNF